MGADRDGQKGHVDDRDAIVEMLRKAYSVEATSNWLAARNRLLNFERPIDLLVRGGFAAVRGAAEAFVDGDYT
jgi:hypothetical protein